jgi:hypothetical protein
MIEGIDKLTYFGYVRDMAPDRSGSIAPGKVVRRVINVTWGWVHMKTKFGKCVIEVLTSPPILITLTSPSGSDL